MADIKLVKLVTGDMVMGIEDKANNGLKDVANVQLIPSGSGISIAIISYGFPFEEDIKGFISNEHVIYEIDKVPAELLDKYTEAKSNIKIAKPSGGDGSIIL